MDARENLEIAYRTLSTIYLSGDNVDLMARAKEHLRRAAKILAESEAEKIGGQDDTRAPGT